MEAAPGSRSAGKLVRGARLALFFPQWNRPCALCVEWVFDEDGLIKRDRKGDPVPRGKAPTPCLKCPKVPAWAKQAGKAEPELRALADEITPENQRALDRYREWRATHSFPADPLVSWLSGPLGAVFEEWQREPAERATLATVALIRLIRANR